MKKEKEKAVEQETPVEPKAEASQRLTKRLEAPAKMLQYIYADAKDETELKILNTVGKFEDFLEWFGSIKFFGKGANFAGIKEWRFVKFDFRPWESNIFVHFSNGAEGIMYSLFDYGRLWSARAEDLMDKEETKND